MKKQLTHCEKYGHSWESTTSDNARKCDHCSAKQLKVRGVWTTPQNTNKLMKKQPNTVNQLQMF